MSDNTKNKTDKEMDFYAEDMNLADSRTQSSKYLSDLYGLGFTKIAEIISARFGIPNPSSLSEFAVKIKETRFKNRLSYLFEIINEEQDQKKLQTRIDEIHRIIVYDTDLDFLGLCLDVVAESIETSCLREFKNLLFALADGAIDKEKFYVLVNSLKNLTRKDLEFIKLNVRANQGYSIEKASQHLNLINTGILSVQGLENEYYFTILAKELDRYALTCDLTASYSNPEHVIDGGHISPIPNFDIDAMFK